MELKKLHIGTVSYNTESMEEVSKIIFEQSHTETPLVSSNSGQRGRRAGGHPPHRQRPRDAQPGRERTVARS